MYKRKNVAVLVRTVDFERFRNTEQENFLSFQRALIITK